MNASKTYYFEFDFFEKKSIKEKQLKIIKWVCEWSNASRTCFFYLFFSFFGILENILKTKGVKN